MITTYKNNMIDKQNIFFNKKRSGFSLLFFLITLGVLLILFGVGAAFDFQIAVGIWDGLNHQEVLGRTVSGTLCNVAFFFLFTIIFSFMICSFSYRKSKVWVTVLSIILGVSMVGLFSYFQYDDFFIEIKKADAILNPDTNCVLPWVFMALAWIVSWIGSFLFAWFFVCKRVNCKLMLRAGLLVIVGACIIIGGKEFWKILWSRPRPSSVMEDSSLLLPFRPVWEIHPFECFNKSISKEYRDQLKSFPSGHTSAAMLMVLSTVGLSSLNIFKSKKTNYLYICLSLLLVLLIAFNRMIARCHFLTDVTGASILALIVSFFIPWCYKKKDGQLLW